MADVATEWRLTFRDDLPSDSLYRVPNSVRREILHSINGLDPHDPVFRRDRCYTWGQWTSVYTRQVSDTNQIMCYVRTPLTPNRVRDRGKSVVRLLDFHRTGRVLRPSQSSHHPCAEHPTTLYGQCCFPNLVAQCHRLTSSGNASCGLCVNPLHMVPMTARAAERERHVVLTGGQCAPRVLQGVRACTRCDWKPGFYTQDKASKADVGDVWFTQLHHGTPVTLDAEWNERALEWKLQGTVSTTVAVLDQQATDTPTV